MKEQHKSTMNEKLNPLDQLGWHPYFQKQLEATKDNHTVPARVVGVSKNSFRINNGDREWLAWPAGRLLRGMAGEWPVAGDWVQVNDTLITSVMKRKNALSRGASGTHNRQDAAPMKEQVIAANLDTVLIVTGLDRDFNLRRIERYLTLVYNCGLNPVIVLTKADLHENPEAFSDRAASIAFGVPVHLISARNDAGPASLAPYLAPGKTTTLVGSSGAGKSTLVNRLCGAHVQQTSGISTHVGKGRHTTTSRDLIRLPQGGMVIDNPGIREIGFWETDNGIDTAFPEIEKFARECRFADCSHTHEPGCRILEAVETGEISPARLDNYQKMKRELDYLSQRRRKSADRVEKERWKDVALKIKAMKKRKSRP